MPDKESRDNGASEVTTVPTQSANGIWPLVHFQPLADSQSKDGENKAASSLEQAQTDGAPAEQFGSTLQEPEFDVEVKLSDMQADPNNPLFSAKTFEELGLYVNDLKKSWPEEVLI